MEQILTEQKYKILLSGRNKVIIDDLFYHNKGTFTLSFGTNDPTLTLPEGARSRIYLQGIDAKDVDTAVETTTVPDRSAQIVFLATTNDTRFDKYSVLRPLSAAKTLEAAKAANAATEEAEQ